MSYLKQIGMNIPTNALDATHNYDEGLTIYNNKYDSTHPIPFWKGVVVDDTNSVVVARSFQCSPAVITTTVDPNLTYTPIVEATILRFYRHYGVPMIATHRTMNIVHTRSRIGSGRFFFDLVKDAISGWEDRRDTFDYEGKKGIAYTPTSWEDLCVEGWCNVFLLVDISNQKTDLVDPAMYARPQLLYSLSLKADTPEMSPVPTLPIFPIPPTEEDGTVYEYMTWCIPTLPHISEQEANTILANGGGVIGFNIESQDVTTKFISPTYARKIQLVNDNTNVVHRWHELMDESEDIAREYLSHLPKALSYIDEKYMQEVHKKFLDETSSYLSGVITSRYLGYDSPMPEILERKSKSIVDTELRKLRNKYSRGATRPSKDKLLKMVDKDLHTAVSSLPYTQQHTLHSKVMDAQRPKDARRS